MVLGYGGSIQPQIFGAATMSVTSHSKHFLSHGGFLCLTTISSLPVHPGRFHSAWIWRVYEPQKFWGGHYDCYFTISTLLVSWWVPMLGNDFKSASASR